MTHDNYESAAPWIVEGGEPIVRPSLASRICLSLASYIAEIDQSSSDVAAYLEQRFEPLWRLVGEFAADRYGGYERVLDDAPKDDPDVRYAEGYEAGVRACEANLREALASIVRDSRKLDAGKERT